MKSKLILLSLVAGALSFTSCNKGVTEETKNNMATFEAAWTETGTMATNWSNDLTAEYNKCKEHCTNQMNMMSTMPDKMKKDQAMMTKMTEMDNADHANLTALENMTNEWNTFKPSWEQMTSDYNTWNTAFTTTKEKTESDMAACDAMMASTTPSTPPVKNK